MARTRPHRYPLLTCVLLIAVVFSIGIASRAGAHTANSSAYTILYIKEDGFRNWDFKCDTSGSCIARTNVDWPMSALFYNNAEINKVKDNILGSRYDQGGTCASPMHARLDDGHGFNWDTDSGKKTTCCTVTGTGDHIRFYAAGYASHDRMYNTAWGYWIVASTHQDHHECGTGTWSGNNETAEVNLYNYWVNSLHRPAYYDEQNFFNYQYNNEGADPVRNDGWASAFWVS
jgi:hypothetical protein